ncbi:hypothetical protein Syun_009996 [Stephania yunnanensis]|uniref:Uncharacterized protein n=1 Tax=Stephania yunnanensis TaxID=152371 RepID=A0AAP0PPK5_9MAGN
MPFESNPSNKKGRSTNNPSLLLFHTLTSVLFFCLQVLFCGVATLLFLMYFFMLLSI